MPDSKKTPEPDEPQDVTVVNPEPLKVEVTLPPLPGNPAAEHDAKVVAAAVVAADAVKADAVVAAAEKLDASNTARQNRKFDFWQVVLVAFIAAAPGIITAYRIGHVSEKVEETHNLVNSTATKLLEEVRKSSRAEGVIEGKAKGKQQGTETDE